MGVRFSERVSDLRPSEIRNKLFDDPEIITFAAGKPEEKLFPVEHILEAAQYVLTNKGTKALQYSDTQGLPEIRQMIASKILKEAGVNTSENNITLTSGSQQGIEFSAKIFVNKGDTIICENPSYVGAFNAFQSYNPKYIGISMDEEGIIIEELENTLKSNSNAKMVYTIPDFQNPTGRSMSIERRKKLAELGSKYQIPIIEDAPYASLVYEGKRLPAIKSYDQDGFVVMLGTFSKVLCPGFRVGWVCAHEEILNKYILTKQSSDLQCSTLNEQILAAYMRKHDLNKHIEELKNEYRKRRDVMLKCIKTCFPSEVKYASPAGGFFIWIELKKEIDADALLLDSLKHAKVAFVPGGSFFIDNVHKNYIRLNFSFVDEDKIEEGIKRLGNLLHRYCN